MTKIEGELLIHRPVDVVFDMVADQRNEPAYNPKMTSSVKLTEGPIGVGTRFRAATGTGRWPVEMLIEYTAFDRPTTLASSTRMAGADVHGSLTFTGHPAGTLLRWSWDVTPKGLYRLLTPLVAWRDADRNGAPGPVSSICSKAPAAREACPARNQEFRFRTHWDRFGA